MIKTSYSNPEYHKLVQLARPFYNYTGPNDWSHIQDVRRRAAAMTRKLYGRGLTPEEYAAVLFHDSTKHEMGAENHGRTAGVRAAHVLAAAMSPQSLGEVTEAIAVHDDNLPKFPSRTAELLASADANPPDLKFGFSKGLRYAQRKGFTVDQMIDNFNNNEQGLLNKYRHGGSFNYPGIYDRFYGKRSAKYKDDITRLYNDPEAIKAKMRELGILE